MSLPRLRWFALRQQLPVRSSHAPIHKWISRRLARPQSTRADPATRSRFDRFIAKTPTRFLRTRLEALRDAPVTHIISFLILHEITAVVPLFGLAGAFHHYQWLPACFAEGEWVLKGVNMFGNWFRRRGWITTADAESAKRAAEEGRAEQFEREIAQQDTSRKKETFGKWWTRGEGGTRWIIEFATAYAVVKALLPLRIVVSVWGAPWFARWTVIPVQNAFRSIRKA